MNYVLVFDYPGEDAESIACADAAAVVTALDERLGGEVQQIQAVFEALQAKGVWLDEGGQVRLHATGGAALCSSGISIHPTTEPGVFDLKFPVKGKCSRGRHECAITVVQGPSKAPAHGWDGNIEAPTVIPSIGCESRGCTFHGHITAGKVTP